MTSTGSAGSLVLACDFAARQPGSFIASQLAVADASHSRLGLRTLFVLPDRARRRDWVPTIAEAGHEVAYLPGQAWRRPAALSAIARRSDAKIIHSHYVWFDLDSIYAATRAGAAAIWHVRNGLVDYPLKQRATDALKARILARSCDAVVAVSESVGNDLLRRGFPRDKIAVIRNALVLDQFRDIPEQRAAARAGTATSRPRFVVASLCWPPHRKGADILVDAAMRLGRRLSGHDLELLLIGEPAGIDSYLRARFADLPPWIRVTPPVPEIADVFLLSDVFVSAAREEGFSFAIGEAMACGLPVVGSNIGGTSHYWPAPGFLVYAVDDAEALAQRLYELATSAGAADVLGERNREWAFEQLGIDRYVDELVALYGRCLESHATAVAAT